MRSRSFVILLLVSFAACGRRPAPAPVEPPVLPVKKKWVAALDGSEVEGPMASDGQRVFVSTREAVTALDRATGKRLWRRADVSGLLSAAPGVVIVRATSGAVTSLDPGSGRTRWKTVTASAGPVPAVLDGARVLVAGSRLVALDTTSGRVVLDQPLDAPAVTPPVRVRERLLIGGADGALRLRDVESARVVWSYPMARPLEAPPLVDDDRIFVGTGDRRAAALKLGGKPDWVFKLGTAVPVSAAAAGRHVFFAASEAVLYALSRSNGHMAWRAALPSRPLGPPLVVGRHVLVACHPDELLAFELETGKPAGKAHAGIERLGAEAGPSEIRTPLLAVERGIYLAIRNPAWAVVALEPGSPPKAPEPPAPFPIEPPADLPAAGANP